MKIDMASTLTSALEGLQVGVNKAREASGEVAKLTTESESVQNTVRPLLRLQDAGQQVDVTSEVIDVENDTLGRFVDESA